MHIFSHWMFVVFCRLIGANWRCLFLFSYGVFGANISSQAMLFAKSGLELLILSIFQGQNQFIYPLTWVLVAALIVTALLQVTNCKNRRKVWMLHVLFTNQERDTVSLTDFNSCITWTRVFPCATPSFLFRSTFVPSTLAACSMD